MTDMIILFICGAIGALSRSFCILEIMLMYVRVIQKKYKASLIGTCSKSHRQNNIRIKPCSLSTIVILFLQTSSISVAMKTLRWPI